LAIIQQGDRPDSSTYVRMKAKAASDAGIKFTHVVLDEKDDALAVLDAVQKLNEDEDVHGVLVQLPLSPNITRDQESKITEAVSPDKDVDG
jgi:methylenetetrahydrofolate dehydrogenase (NADP+)/methenyltetrahydrofolate cyclohydrolase/formyltetrahydrofolate synthetase